jgi:hypothetical protein
MIRRCPKYHVVGQHDPNDLSYLDFGDASRSTGILSLFGSAIDMNLCRIHYYGNGKFYRQPEQTPWNNTDNFSRDQLVPLIGGLWRAGEKQILREALFFRLKRSLFGLIGLEQNFDILAPNHLFMLILAARFRLLYFLGPIGYFFHFLNMIWSCFIKPWDEQNQFICECMVFGTAKIYKKLHPDYKKAIMNYWGGFPFRDQPELGKQIINNL